MYLRRLSLLLAIVLTLILLPQLALPAQAAYENTYKNTGNQRSDIIGVALTQVGYREGDGKSNNNQNKYSEYFNHGARAWCGDFVSWCARQAGIPTSVLKTSGPAKPSTFGISTVHKSGYTPQPGDLFFKSNESHVGIVYYTSGKYFYTIEGNTWTGSPRRDGVYVRKRLISDFHFGVPNYTGDSGNSGGTVSCSHSYTTANESEHPHKEYKICSKCSDKSYTGNKATVDSCKSCIQESCTHKYSDWEKSSSTKHKRICTLCEKSETAKHNWSKAEITKEPTCNEAGSQKQTCEDCAAEKTESIAATKKHTFDDPLFIDDKYHAKVCTSCDTQEKSAHSKNSEWTSDGKNHWLFCEECSERYQLAAHNYTKGCGSACEVCDYISPFEHELSDTYSSDGENHWKECTVCKLAVQPEAHVYGGECDDICNVCEASRETMRNHTNEMRSDKLSHWQECTVCAQIQEQSAHDPDQSAKDWETQLCLTCNYVIRSKDEHVHTYESIDYDRRTHWGTCACGVQIPAEGHRWSMESGRCNICLAQSSPIATHLNYDGAQMEYDWIVLIVFCIFIIIVAVMMVILLIRRIRKNRFH